MELLALFTPFIFLGAVLAMPIAFVVAILVNLCSSRSRSRLLIFGTTLLGFLVPALGFDYWLRSLSNQDIDGPVGFGLTVIWIVSWSASIFGAAFFALAMIETNRRRKKAAIA